MIKLQAMRGLLRLCGPLSLARVVWAKLLHRDLVCLPVPSSESSVLCRFNNSDLVVFLGTFLHGDSLIDMSPEPTLIFDLGANAGFTAIQLARRFPNARVVAVEADKANYELCLLNTKAFGSVLVLWRAVSVVPGLFYKSNPGSIAMSHRFAAADIASAESVQGVTMASLLADHARPDDVVLVKMDIEGAERSLFLDDTSWLNSVDAVLVEPHGKGTDEIIKKAIVEKGFRLGQVGEKLMGQNIRRHEVSDQ